MTVMHLMIGLAAANAPAAQVAPVQRLSEAEVAQVLDEAAAKREAAEAAAPVPKREIHGEVGVAAGTGGYRAAYGSALVPLGEESTALLQFSTETGRQRYGRRHR